MDYKTLLLDCEIEENTIQYLRKFKIAILTNDDSYKIFSAASTWGWGKYPIFVLAF